MKLKRPLSGSFAKRFRGEKRVLPQKAPLSVRKRSGFHGANSALAKKWPALETELF
jgi:hypothetical protein